MNHLANRIAEAELKAAKARKMIVTEERLELLSLLQEAIEKVTQLDQPRPAVKEIIELVDGKISKCKLCGKPFWRIRRQLFCTVRCAKKVHG